MNLPVFSNSTSCYHSNRLWTTCIGRTRKRREDLQKQRFGISMLEIYFHPRISKTFRVYPFQSFPIPGSRCPVGDDAREIQTARADCQFRRTYFFAYISFIIPATPVHPFEYVSREKSIINSERREKKKEKKREKKNKTRTALNMMLASGGRRQKQIRKWIRWIPARDYFIFI